MITPLHEETMDMTIDNPRHLPKVDDLLRDERMIQASESYGYVPLRQAVRHVLEEARSKLLDRPEEEASLGLTRDQLLEAVLIQVESDSRPGIRKVINATGAILHTNLGRAPLAREALDAVMACSEG